MRRVALCLMFNLGVFALLSGISASRQCCDPEELIEWDINWTAIEVECNGDYTLRGGCWGYGIKGADYRVRMAALDGCGIEHPMYLMVNGVGTEKQYSDYPSPYDGTSQYREFGLTVVKAGPYWQEIDNNGKVTVRATLKAVEKGVERTVDFSDGKLTLP